MLLVALPVMLLPAAVETRTEYVCPGGETFAVTFQAPAGTPPGGQPAQAALQVTGKPRIVLPRAPSASGAKYSDGYTVFWTKGDDALILSGAVNLLGCTAKRSASAGTPALSGKWRLTSLSGAAVTMARAPTIEFLAGGRAAGFAGCNRFSASCQQEGSSLKFGQAIATRMACPQPQMDLENQFLRVIGATVGYRLSGGLLTLLDPEGVALAEFRNE